MNQTVVTVLLSLLGFALGALVSYLFKKTLDQRKRKTAAVEAEKIISKAKAESARLEREARNKAKDIESKAKRQAESDINRQKSKLQADEKLLNERKIKLEADLNERIQDADLQIKDCGVREEKLKTGEKRLKELELENKKRLEELRASLTSISSLSEEEARRLVLQTVADEAREEAAKVAAQVESEVMRESEKKAKKLIAAAVSRVASEYTTERTVTVLSLPSDEMKGKIIGREGRNIRTLETACGVDLIVDETPESVVISSFDPIRREHAKRTLEKLMEDGRVHPARIEEVAEKIRKDLLKNLREDGEKAVYELGLAGLNPEIVRTLGSLKLRTHQAQNLLAHSLEVAQIAGFLASEIGEDPKRARRAGLLHDIGKGLDHTME